MVFVTKCVDPSRLHHTGVRPTGSVGVTDVPYRTRKETHSKYQGSFHQWSTRSGCGRVGTFELFFTRGKGVIGSLLSEFRLIVTRRNQFTGRDWVSDIGPHTWCSEVGLSAVGGEVSIPGSHPFPPRTSSWSHYYALIPRI